LSSALGDAAVNLAVGEQWIDDAAGVVDGEVLHERGRSRFGVDLDDGHVRAEWIGRVGRPELIVGSEAELLSAHELPSVWSSAPSPSEGLFLSTQSPR
jgi:hypothetical protein